MVSGIYAIVNTISGKRYVGSTVNLKKRKCQHWYRLRKNKHGNAHLQNAWNLYGEANFRFEIVEYVHWEFLLDAEQRYLDANCGGYNMATCAEASARGRIRSAETCARIGASKKGQTAHNKGKTTSDEDKASVSEGTRRAMARPEIKAKISSGQKRAWADPIHRAKMGAAHIGQIPWCKGQHLSAEHRANVSEGTKKAMADSVIRTRLMEAGKRNWADPAYRAKMIAARNRRGKHSLETRLKMSIAHKTSKIALEHLAKLNASQRGRKHTPEAIARMRIIHKQRWAAKKEGADQCLQLS